MFGIKDSTECQAKILEIHKSGKHHEIKLHGLTSLVKEKDFYIIVEDEDEQFFKKHTKKNVKIDWDYDQFYDTKELNILKVGLDHHQKRKHCWRMINVEEI